MKALEVIALGSGVTLLIASCVVTDVDDGAPDGEGGEGGGSSEMSSGGGVSPGIGGSASDGGARVGNTVGGMGGASGYDEHAGKVSCGELECDVPLVCCVIDGAPQCMEAAVCADLSTPNAIVVMMKCDDASDCTDDEACCAGGAAPFTNYACGPTPCEQFEVCMANTPCITADTVCTESIESASGYACTAS